MSKTERPTIPNAKLDRIDTDISWITMRVAASAPALSRFSYDHSNTLVHDTKGKCDLLIPNTVPMASDIARLLQHTSPAIVKELVRGYRLARAAGLLDDGTINAEVAKHYSTLGCGFSPPERIENGCRVAGRIRDTLRLENHKPGGVPLMKDPTHDV